METGRTDPQNWGKANLEDIRQRLVDIDWEMLFTSQGKSGIGRLLKACSC